VESLLQWLQGQIGDERLIANTSLYRERAGELIASPLLTLQSRFDAPGVAAVSAEAFAAPPVTVLRAGRLETLTPGFYASRRTGLAHVPTAAGGWALDAGTTPLAELIAAVPRGALVDRLSMGAPAADGGFSGVIKNSFVIEGGTVGAALSETMVSGNMARMLLDVSAVSRERIDGGALLLPWLRIGGLHFS
jgi:PmbA protein